MNKVRILPSNIVSKIAAGEVIERPASAVKELIENALDAQTRSIELQIKNAGKSFIKLKDSGSGIEPEDIKTIFSRHATSKIQQEQDLYEIRSLGFRGEALYSIAAVSDIILRSKIESGETGWQIHLRGGKLQDFRPISTNEGTEIEIRELFFNVPARRKFLKTDPAELHQILNIFVPYCILYPEVKFRLAHYNKVIVDLPPAENKIERIQKALNINPKHLLKNDRAIAQKNIALEIILSDINIQRTRKDLQFVFINNRPVYNSSISYHLNEVYKSILPPKFYPFFAVYITLPPGAVDVNIHPTKRQVKIKDEYFIIQNLRSLAEETLLNFSKPKQIENSPVPTMAKTSTNIPATNRPDSPEKENNYFQQTFIYKKAPVFTPQKFHAQSKETLKHKLIVSKYIGPFCSKYLFFESGDSLIVIDQHAAQERITFEQLIHQAEAGKIETQRLISPFLVHLTAQEMVIWEMIKTKLESLGFETTLWDKDTIALHAYPGVIKNYQNCLGRLLTFEEKSQRLDTQSLARRACKASLTAGYQMSFQQANYLLNQLLSCKDPFICPHGRPTAVEIKETLLQKNFLR